MSPPSQYQALRLLDLVRYNKKSVRDHDHVDHDVWARHDPPVLGLNFPNRATARAQLKAGDLGARITAITAPEPPQVDMQTLNDNTNTVELNTHPLHEDVDKGAIPSAPANPGITRVGSSGSRMSRISSVPSFGKLREPLSSDSILQNTPTEDAILSSSAYQYALATQAPPAEYQEYGSEALITHVYDGVDDDEFDDSSPSQLFHDIGPSISMAHDIHKTSPKPSEQQYSVMGSSAPDDADIYSYKRHMSSAEEPSPGTPQNVHFSGSTLEPNAASRILSDNYPARRLDEAYNSESDSRVDDFIDDIAVHEAVQSTSTAIATSSYAIPETGNTNLDGYTEPEQLRRANYDDLLHGPPVVLNPPPPPPPLHAVKSYGSTPAVPAPPSPPPPKSLDGQFAALKLTNSQLHNSKDTSPMTGSGELIYEYEKPQRAVHDEFSDLADNSLPSMSKDNWYKKYQQGHFENAHDAHESEQEGGHRSRHRKATYSPVDLT